LVAGHRELGDRAAVAVQDRGGMAVAVGIDPDDGIGLAFWHGHLRLSSSQGGDRVGAGLGAGHRPAGR
jgi:hypothetical protein